MPTQLPIGDHCAGRKTDGFCTPKEDKMVQRMRVPPRRVIPIIFLPGIMGSNLRMSPAVQQMLGKTNNIAWRPDRIMEMLPLVNAAPILRQQIWNPEETEVDVFDPVNGSTGDRNETAEKRHYISDIDIDLLNVGRSPLLVDDLPTQTPRRTKEDKARLRGWSEVYFGSYGQVLKYCEEWLNSPATSSRWRAMCEKSPADWEAVAQSKLTPLTQNEIAQALEGCFFPVHAMGYNWLRSNSESALAIRERILKLIHQYQQDGYICKKVILLTHSMGGLVARAAIHPDIGDLGSSILGVVHGVMPATGAPAAYKRMRCGFEEQWFGLHPAPKILGNSGDEVTPVLGNSMGGLELLPSKAYGNGWLRIRQGKVLFDRFPKNGDPYEEIYKLKDRWYGLLRPEWLNPAGMKGSGIELTVQLLDGARRFHDTIESTYHENSFAHYGVDSARPSWETVTWNLKRNVRSANWHGLKIASDSGNGRLSLYSSDEDGGRGEEVDAVLDDSDGIGDETVPSRSADHQWKSAKFKGVFRQSGYEHQASYSNNQVLEATLYSIVRIAATMKWGDDANS